MLKNLQILSSHFFQMHFCSNYCFKIEFNHDWYLFLLLDFYFLMNIGIVRDVDINQIDVWDSWNNQDLIYWNKEKHLQKRTPT